MVVLPPVDEPQVYNQNYVLYWNSVALDLNRLVVTIAGPNNGPPGAARALGILHLAIHDAYFAIKPDQRFTTYLSSTEGEVKLPPTLGATDARLAVAGAANTVLMQQYTTPSSNVATASTIQLAQFIQDAVTAFPNLDTLSPSYRFGIEVGKAILSLLAIKPGEPGFDQDSYRPTPGKFKFDDDPTNPIRLVPVNINDPNGPKKAVHIYQAPFYGLTAKRLAVQGSMNGASTDHVLADPPSNDPVEYYSVFDDVYREGGAQTLNTTRRTPQQTVSGFFWAYDGSNLIGTPLRLFNQIMRKIAFDRRPAGIVDEATNADFVRLFALFNVSLADVGIFAWREKYNFEFWRPLSGVREDDTPFADPFWLTLGAPETNSNQIPIKPPFPSCEYLSFLHSRRSLTNRCQDPSGHASFAGAGFQAARLYYKERNNLTFADDAPDDIAFEFVSEELNGVSRDLRNPYDPNIPITDQPGTIRTRVPRKFSSLWDAMYDTAISRVFLGVHWRFDAFASRDVLASTTVKQDGTTDYKASQDVRYETWGPRADRPGLFPIGGVPLGIGVANDIFQSKLKQTPASFQPSGRNKNGDGAAVEAAPTTGVTSMKQKLMMFQEDGNGVNGDH